MIKMSQWEDFVVKSVLESRAIRTDLNDEQFIEWYSERYMVLEQRVKGILELVGRNADAIPTH